MAAKRLIDANTLKKCAEIMATFEPVMEKAIGFVNALIDLRPTEATVEVVHGKWLIHKGHFHDYAECSLCGEDYGKDTAMAFNYCPNCGAKMDGGNEDANTD